MTNLDQTFAALSDTTRRALVAELAKGEAPLSDLARPFDMSLTAVSKHLRVLSEAGLVEIEKRGRTRFCRLQAAPMKSASEWLHDYRNFWEGQLDALGRHLREEKD